MTNLPEGWDSYDPNDHEGSDQPSYQVGRAAAARRAERRRAAYGEALSTLRHARALTQVAVAEQLGVAQGEVSRIEHQADLLLSTLARYIDGMDGTLSLLVRFDDNETIELSLMLDDLAEENPTAAAIVPDSMTVIRLAGYIGRYDSQEERFMPLLPPELTQRFQSQEERAAARHRLVARNRTLKTIEKLSRKPASDWTPSERAAFPDKTNGITEPPHQRLGRWASLFADELNELHQLVEGPREFSDLELQEGLYLAGRLLATVTGLLINQVDNFRLPPNSP